PVGSDGAVDPEREARAVAGDFVDVPFAGFLAALRHILVRRAKALFLAVHQGVAEEVTDVLAADLGLMPDLAVGGVADVDAAVVALLAFELFEAPLDVRDAVGDFAVVKKHLVNADAFTDKRIAFAAPTAFLSKLAARRNGDALPACQSFRGEQIEPTRRLGLQGALRFFDVAGVKRTRGDQQDKAEQEAARHGVPP